METPIRKFWRNFLNSSPILIAIILVILFASFFTVFYRFYMQLEQKKDLAVILPMGENSNQIVFLDPQNNSTIDNDLITVRIWINGDSAVKSVDLFIDDKKIGEDKHYPYYFDFDPESLRSGSHTLKAIAYRRDFKNNVGQIEIVKK